MTECPTCRAPLDRDATFCLQCGTRLVAEPEPRPRWGVPATIVAVIALVAIGGVVFALEQVESDAEREATKPAAVLERPEPEAPVEGDARPTEVASWPPRTSAFTVALARLPDETTARARAAAAIDSGIPVGLLDAEGHPTLASSDWLMFSGRFESRATAVEEAARFATAGFPDAEVVFVSERSGG